MDDESNELRENITNAATEIIEESIDYERWQEKLLELLSHPIAKILINYIMKYVTMAVFTYKFIKSLYDRSHKRKYERHIELKELENQFQLVNTELRGASDDFAEVSMRLNTHVDRFGSVRSRVRELIANDTKFQTFIDDIQSLESNLMGKAKDDLFLAADILHRLKYDEPISANKPDRHLEDFVNVYNVSQSNTSIGTSDKSGGDHASKYGLIKVINVYKVAYMRNSMRQKRLKRFQRQNSLKKQAEDIKNLLQEWQHNLSEAVHRKMDQPETVSAQISEVNSVTESDDLSALEPANYENDTKIDTKNEINWFNKSFETSKYVNSIDESSDIDMRPNGLFVLQEETKSEAEDLDD